MQNQLRRGQKPSTVEALAYAQTVEHWRSDRSSQASCMLRVYSVLRAEGAVLRNLSPRKSLSKDSVREH